MKTTVLLSAVGLLTLGLASSAFAQPQECTFGQGATNYWNAKSTYGQQMRNYWEGLNRNCDQQEQVESIFGNYFDETGPLQLDHLLGPGPDHRRGGDPHRHQFRPD